MRQFMNAVGLLIAGLGPLAIFMLNEYIAAAFGQHQLGMTDFNFFVCCCMCLVILFRGPAFLTVAILKFLSLKEKQFVRVLVMSVFIISFFQDLTHIGKNLSQQMRCANKEEEEQLVNVMNKTQNFYHDIESRVMDLGTNLTENEGKMIEKILERSQGLIKVKEDITKFVDKMENMEEVCKKKLESFTDKECKGGITLVDEHMAKQHNVIEFFWKSGRRLIGNAINASCEKIVKSMKENSPCSMHRKLIQKMKTGVKEQTRETTEGMDSEPDTFDVEIEKEFSYTFTNDISLKMHERFQNFIDSIDSVMEILASGKKVMFFLIIPLMFLCTTIDIRKFKEDLSYSNRKVGALAISIDKEEKRGVLPLQLEETRRYSMSTFTFNSDAIKGNLSTMFLLLFPMLGEVLIMSVDEPRLFSKEDMMSETFKNCHGKEMKETEFPWVLYGIVLAAYTASIIIQSFLGNNLEVALLEFHYPKYKKLRALWLLDDIVTYRRQYIRPRKQVVEGRLEKLIAHIPWPHTECFQCHRFVYWKRDYCKNALCSVLLCSTCITKPCLNCVKLRKLDRIRANNWWKLGKR